MRFHNLITENGGRGREIDAVKFMSKPAKFRALPNEIRWFQGRGLVGKLCWGGGGSNPTGLVVGGGRMRWLWGEGRAVLCEKPKGEGARPRERVRIESFKNLTFQNYDFAPHRILVVFSSL
ncbi:unnamed protein product [Prunus armeniaca]